MPQAIDAVAHDKAHRARIIVGPDTLGTGALLGFEKFFRNKVERFIPRNSFKIARTLRTLSSQWMQKPMRMMLTFGIACDFRANHARGVIVVFRSAHAPDRTIVEQFDLERASRRAVVRTRRCADANRRTDVPNGIVHRHSSSVLKG